MRKRFFNSKRILTLMLALSLVVGEAGVVVAAPAATGEQTEVSVSANEVATETDATNDVKVQDSDVSAETAYDGTVSKVIGLKGKSTEISEKHKVRLSWNQLSTQENFVHDNKVIQIGYQVEENGVIVMNDDDKVSADGQYKFISSISYTSDTVVSPGQVMTYRVRGLYYTEEKTVAADGTKTTTYNVFSTGAWSDTYIYTVPAFVVASAPAAVSIELVEDEDMEKEWEISWTEVPEAQAYYVEYIRSTEQLVGLTKDNWSAVYKREGQAYTDFEIQNPSAGYMTGGSRKTALKTTEWVSDTYPYIYVCVRVSEVKSYLDGYKVDTNQISDVASAAMPVQSQKAEKVANVPQVQNFRVEYLNDRNSIRLTWDPVDAKVIIYAVEKSKGFPEWYNMKKMYAYKQQENGSYSYLEYALDNVTRQKIYSNVKSFEIGSGLNNVYEAGSYSNLKYGVDYEFVAHTYDDDIEVRTAEKTPITYNGESFDVYTEMSPASAIVTAKMNLVKPSLYVASGIDNLKLTMIGNGTGFEIYKKSGKKYKKLTTTTDSVYTDTGLKKNSQYSYKVRAYAYNKDSKVKSYSDWVYITGETSDVKNMHLEITKKNKTSVTLKWTKVKGAVRYEIYRSSIDSEDPYHATKKNSALRATSSQTEFADKYELIKTIKKASTTKYVDKKLTQGASYDYVVKAYYKNGKSTMYTSDSASVLMDVQVPAITTSIKGSNLKISWKKDKFAANYEIRYRIYDAEDELISVPTALDDYVYVSTKKNTYTISGVPVGGSVELSIRAYGGGKYTIWSSLRVLSGFGTVKSIKANNVTVKNVDGVDVDAVKITWKPVEGAAYYKVYRSTKQGRYNEDYKTYSVPSEAVTIAKESNDDESTANSKVSYEEYLGIKDSIAGTTAYDFAQLDDGVTYYYYVRAFAPTEKEDEGIQSFSSGKPSSITFNATVSPELKSKKGKALITWDKVPGATKYYVYRSTKKNTGYKLVGSTKKATYTDKKVSKGKTYYYKIEATGTNALKANFTSMSSAKKIKVKK